MDKPISLSVKDWLIRKMAVKMMVSEKTIEAVVNHQFQSANEALSQNKSVEISGFGKFIFNDKKGQKKMAKLEQMERALKAKVENPETRTTLNESKLASVRTAIQILKPKFNVELKGTKSLDQFFAKSINKNENVGLTNIFTFSYSFLAPLIVKILS